MALNFGSFFSGLFDQSIRDNLGINAKGSENIWSCTGNYFYGSNPNTSDISYASNNRGEVVVDGAVSVIFFAPIFLPNRAIINSIVVYGNAAATAETYSLAKSNVTNNSAANLGSENIGTEKKVVNVEEVNNEKFAYYITTSSLDINDEIWGAVVKYTI